MRTPPTHWWKSLHASWGKCPNLGYQVRKKAVTCWFLENWQYIRNTTSSCIKWEGFRVLNTSRVLPSSSSTSVSPPSLKDPQESSGFQKRGVGSGLDTPSAFPSDPDPAAYFWKWPWRRCWSAAEGCFSPPPGTSFGFLSAFPGLGDVKTQPDTFTSAKWYLSNLSSGCIYGGSCFPGLPFLILPVHKNWQVS